MSLRSSKAVARNDYNGYFEAKRRYKYGHCNDKQAGFTAGYVICTLLLIGATNFYLYNGYQRDFGNLCFILAGVIAWFVLFAVLAAKLGD